MKAMVGNVRKGVDQASKIWDIHKLRLQNFRIFDPLLRAVCMWFALTIPPQLLGLPPLHPPLFDW